MATLPKNPPDNKAAGAAQAGIPAIKVLCAQEGFRRAGHAFGPEAKTIALSDLKKDQLAAIEGEPRLITVRTTIDPVEADEAAQAAACDKT